MTQAFDMKRLHMGCGESLQAHLPLLYPPRQALSLRGQGQLSQLIELAFSVKKSARDGSR